MPVTKDLIDPEAKSYELGLLLTPLLTEEAATTLLNVTLKLVLEKHEAAIAEISAPKMIPLAYTIRKRIDNKNQIFREAHFAFIHFSTLPENIPSLKEEIRKMSEVVRLLLIVVPKVGEIVERREKVLNETTTANLVKDETTAIDQGIDNLLAADVLSK